MFYTSLLQDLLRTNSVEINLFLYAENKYVRPLQQLLASLGFFTLPEKQDIESTNQIFDHTLLKAIKKFKNTFLLYNRHYSINYESWAVPKRELFSSMF